MKPLTIEELKALKVGDWVWIKDLVEENRCGYHRVESINPYPIILKGCGFYLYVLFPDYGTKWLAYKNKEQAEAEEYKIEFDEQGGWLGYQYIPAYYQPLCTADTKEAVEALIKKLRGEK